ncbi:MAG: hypothetical protein M3162_09595 [Thermoproteota archaeon]|nr:hypothetical protein [Thermoproteota archaeon]
MAPTAGDRQIRPYLFMLETSQIFRWNDIDALDPVRNGSNIDNKRSSQNWERLSGNDKGFEDRYEIYGSIDP